MIQDLERILRPLIFLYLLKYGGMESFDLVQQWNIMLYYVEMSNRRQENLVAFNLRNQKA